MPFWTSFLVRTFAWIVLLGRSGAVNDLLVALGLVEYPVRMIYNFTGVMIGMVHALMPLCVLTMLSVMINIDTNLTRAASTLGARGGQAFWRVYFPLSVPGVAAGGLLVFITALGFFITPALLGGRKDTMIVQLIIFQIHEVLNWAFAGAIALLLLVTVLAIFFLYDRLLGLSTLSGETAAAGAARRHGSSPAPEAVSGDCSRPGWATCARPRRACSTASARTARTAPGAGFREACCGRPACSWSRSWPSPRSS